MGLIAALTLTGTTLTGMYNVQKRDDTNDSIGRFLFANGIMFYVARSPYYKEMVQTIAAVRPSYVLPGEHKLRTTVLERKVLKINVQKEHMRQTWVRVGALLLSMGGQTSVSTHSSTSY